jgi:hypothetical protein
MQYSTVLYYTELKGGSIWNQAIHFRIPPYHMYSSLHTKLHSEPAVLIRHRVCYGLLFLGFVHVCAKMVYCQLGNPRHAVVHPRIFLHTVLVSAVPDFLVGGIQQRKLH